MPLYALRCLEGHEDVTYCHVPDDYGCATRICACGATCGRVLSFGTGLTYFSESHPVVIENLGHDPVTIRSPAEHRAAMKRAGVTWATRGP